MAGIVTFDPEASHRLETMYASPEVSATRAEVFRAVTPRSGQKGLDVGCGPGYLTRDLGLAVGASGEIAGIDSSEPMLDLARQRCSGLSQITLTNAGVESLPTATGTLDFACALQIYCYVKELDGALDELRRCLRPGGRAVIMDTDFSGALWETGDRARMRKIMTAFEGHSVWPDLPRILPRRLAKAGFELTRCDAIPFVTLAYHPNTYIHGSARIIHQYVTKSAGLPVPEADAWLKEFDELETRREFFFSVNRFMFVATRR